MSDNLLLTSLWLLPLIGMAVVLAIPRRSEATIKYVSLGFTVAAFVVSLIALGEYLGDEVARSSLQTRAAQNILQAELVTGPLTVSDESKGQNDLVVRRPWIPYFNIQY